MHGLAGGDGGREEPAHDGDYDAAHAAADQHTGVDELVTQVDAVKARLGNATEQAGGKSTDGGLAHVLILVADGEEQHTGSGTEAGEVPHAHRALNEVVAQGVDVHDHQSVQRPVQTQRHQERVQQRDCDGEDERSVSVHPGESGAEAVAGPHTDRSDDESGERTDDDHGEERQEDHLDAVRNDLLQTVVHDREHGDHQQRHEHVAGVVGQLHRQAEHRGGAGGGAQRGVLHTLDGVAPGLGVRQGCELRGHEHAHDCAAQPRIHLELLGCIVGDHNRQEVEHTLPDGLHEHQAGGGGVVRNQAQGNAQVDQCDDDGRAKQHTQNRAEGVGQVFEEAIEPCDLAASLGTSGGLDLRISRLIGIVVNGAGAETSHFWQVHDLLIHGGDLTADNDLVSVAGLRHGAQHKLVGVERGIVNLAGVIEFKAQSRGAVRQRLDVGRATNTGDDCLDIVLMRHLLLHSFSTVKPVPTRETTLFLSICVPRTGSHAK